MAEILNIVINGMGGQGIVFCGEVIAKAVHDHNPKAFVVQNQNYSAQARGGFSQSTVILSCEPIFYPLVDFADIVIYTGDEGFKIKSKVSPKGIIIAEEGLNVEEYFPENKIYYVSLRKTLQKLGDISQLNLLILGILQSFISNFISSSDMEKEIGNYFKGDKLRESLAIIEAGRGLIIN